MIRRFKNISARTKILLFAFLFIIVPSGILGYLGFRSIGNRGLVLKENYRSLARLMREEFEAELAGLEGRFVREALDREWTGDVEADRIRLGDLRTRHPAIGEAVLLGPDGSLIHPEFSLAPESPAREETAGSRARRNGTIARGERYEFAELDYAMAARSYEEALRKAASPADRCYARLLLGRSYFKMKDYAKAAEQYRILSERGGDARGSDGTPLNVIGLFRLAETHGALGNGKRELQTLLTLVEELSLGPRTFESRDFYLESATADVERIFQSGAGEKNDADRWERLKAEDKVRTEEIRRMAGIRQTLLTRLDLDAPPNTPNPGSPGPDSSSVSHLTIRDESGKPSRVGYVFLPARAGSSGKGILAYEFDPTFVLSEVFPRLIGRRESGENIRPVLCGAEGPLSSPRGSPPIAQALAVEGLSEYFPGWSVALFDARGKSIDQIVRREMRLYGALLFGMTVLIVSGIVLTLRAATHEAEIVRLRSDFVSNISHELKTPLSLIRLFGETLESDEPTPDATRREFSRIIARESRRLTHLIDNVLDFSKIDAGRKEYDFERADLVRLVSDTLEAYRFYLREQGFEFDVSLPPGPVFVSMDRDATAQALLNLLNNAEKYSGERKYIGVAMTLTQDRAMIAVEDKGPGIPPSDLKHIFEKFYRARTGPAGEAQGCGLGLTIVKNTVEIHGGEVRAESEPGRGSRFIITLPLATGRGENAGSSEGEDGQDPDR